MGRFKRALYASGTVVLIFAAMAVLAEVAFHLLGLERRYMNPMSSFHVQDPVLGYRGRPNFEGRFAPPGRWDVRVVHDERGFRAQEFATPEHTCTRRVYVYGDSFTWGWGVDQGEVFTDLMNRDSEDSCIHNRGLNASGTVLQYTVFRHEDLAEMSPGDVVFVLFCMNDFHDNYDQDEEVTGLVEDGEVRIIPPREPFQTPLKAFLKKNSYLYNMASTASYRMKRALRTAEDSDEPPKYPILERDDSRILVTEYVLREFKRDCAEADISFYLALIPSSNEFGEPVHAFAPEIAANYREQVSRIANELDIELIDLLPEFLAAKESDPGPLTLADDGHWNPRGHQLVAEVLLGRIGKLQPAP